MLILFLQFVECFPKKRSAIYSVFIESITSIVNSKDSKIVLKIFTECEVVRK